MTLRGAAHGPTAPRTLADRPRRAQTFLRTLGIEITFSREGRLGTRMITVSTRAENTVSTVSIVGAARTNGSGRDHHGLAGVPATAAADDADGADASSVLLSNDPE
jgi:hypothetical protein